MTDTVANAFDLSGHVALVTGGNSGIGLGIATGLAQAGANIALWGRDTDRNERAKRRLSEQGTRVFALRCDVSDEQQVDRAMSATLEEFGAVHSCFAVAGINRQTPFTDTMLAEFREITDVNLSGTFLTFRAAARHMVEAGGGSLVGVSSIAAHSGQPRACHYAASKAGITALVRSTAVELARYGVRANAIVPGWVRTSMIEDFLANPRFVERVLKRIPHRRWGRPEDFGALAVYLAGPASAYHTGDEIVVDGGYSLF